VAGHIGQSCTQGKRPLRGPRAPLIALHALITGKAEQRRLAAVLLGRKCRRLSDGLKQAQGICRFAAVIPALPARRRYRLP